MVAILVSDQVSREAEHDGGRAQVFRLLQCQVNAFADDPLVSGCGGAEKLRGQFQDMVRAETCLKPFIRQFDPIAFDTGEGDF